MKIDPNWGVLERWWAVQWAMLKAEAYAVFNPHCRIHVENNWVEDRGTRDADGYNEWKENVLYVAVIKGSILKGNLTVVKEYYGKAHINLEAFNDVNASQE